MGGALAVMNALMCMCECSTVLNAHLHACMSARASDYKTKRWEEVEGCLFACVYVRVCVCARVCV